ncbi:hypothetical protein ACFL3V_04765 [Nanoarchaeota archaeon]
MNKRQFFALFLLVVLLATLISGCAGVSRLNSFFENDEYKQHSKIIDFGLFFVIFFALGFLGFSQVWGKGFGKPGEGKGAIVGLSLALSLALSFALITQTRFSITTIFPVAKAMFFLVITFLLGGLIIHSKVFGEGKMAKFIAFLIALIGTYLIFSIGTHFVCQMQDNLDDPACQSDAFTFLSTYLGRWFGIEDWSWGSGSTWSSGPGGSTGGGRDGGGGGGTTPTPTPTPTPVVTGPTKGGCRLDILFQVDSTSIAGGSPIADYVNKVKAMGKSINIYGFASEECAKCSKSHNEKLARSRAQSIEKMIRIVDSSIGTSLKPRGETKIFSTSLPPNRRVVLSTEPLSGVRFLPAPGTGSLYNCTDQPIPPEEKDEEGGFSWWWIIPILLLLLLLLLLKKKRKIKKKTILAMKDRFLLKMEAIEHKKKVAWWEINAAYPKTMVGLSSTDIHSKAQDTIDMLNKELADKGWVSIRKLAFRYAKNPKLIEKESVPFRIDIRHAKLIVRLLQDLQRTHAPSRRKFIKHFLKQWDKAKFYSRLRKIVANDVTNNHLFTELHVFFNLQEELRKYVNEFVAHEQKFLETVRHSYHYTFAGKRFVGTRMIKGKKGFPWVHLPSEMEERPDEEEIIDPAPHTKGLVDITEEVRDLCMELRTKIDEIVAEEKNIHNHHDYTKLSKHYDEEKELIKKLKKAIDDQKKNMVEFRIRIVSPHSKKKFTPDEQPEFVAEVTNGNPPFRYKWFWGPNYEVELTPTEQNTSNNMIRFKLPWKLEDIPTNMRDSSGNPLPALADRLISGEKDTFKVAIKLYDDQSKPKSTDYGHINDYLHDHVLIVVSEKLGKVKGRVVVTDSTCNIPIKKAKVWIDLPDGTRKNAVCDDKGEFTIEKVPHSIPLTVYASQTGFADGKHLDKPCGHPDTMFTLSGTNPVQDVIIGLKAKKLIVVVHPATNPKLPHPPNYGGTLQEIAPDVKMIPPSKGGIVAVSFPDINFYMNKLEKHPDTSLQLQLAVFRKRADDASTVPDPTKDKRLDPDVWHLRIRFSKKKKVNKIVGIDPVDFKMNVSAGPLEFFPFVDTPKAPDVQPGEFYYIFARLIHKGKELDHNWIELKIRPPTTP